MDLSLYTARISAQVSDFSGRVYGAAELAVALENLERVTKPAAYVIWQGDSPLDASPIPGQQARFQEDIGVVVIVGNTTDLTGEMGVASVETIASTLQTALVGWAPSSSHLPVFYTGSSFAGMDAGVLVHLFNFSSVVPGGSIFTYNIQLRVELVGGATVADAFANYAAAVDGVIGASTRLTSDYLLDREAIPESATRYQLKQVPAAVDETRDATTATSELSVRLSVHHHLAPTDVERTYTETTMVTALNSLLPPSFWRNDQLLIRQVLERPELGLGADLARE